MSKLKAAEQLVGMGFSVFPIIEDAKTPYIKNFSNASISTKAELKTFWWDSVMEIEHNHNIGIATDHYGKDEALIVVDVDNKGEKHGSATILALAHEGYTFPKTLTQKTPSGGFHFIYKTKTAVKQGVDVLGSGLDIRSRGGYILAAGSILKGRAYTFDITCGTDIKECPPWLLKALKDNENKEREIKKKEPTTKISQKGACNRAAEYLQNHAPVAVEGANGDSTTFMVAARLKDLGVSEANALNLMNEHWNINCQPPWELSELEFKIENAYAYGQNSPGIDSPESDFSVIPKEDSDSDKEDDEILDPMQELNKEYAFVILGGKSTILKKDLSNEVQYLNLQSFHDLLKPNRLATGNGKFKQISQMWMSSLKRKTYDFVEMSPGRDSPPGVYNLWQGFRVEPLSDDENPTEDMKEGVRLFKEHALENVCYGDLELFSWLMGYFAHLVQRPWEKPLTALVFKGKKGVGKNAIIERIGYLLGNHVTITANRRFLLSNFNGHLAKSLLFVLDEAFWSGDKQAEGILKDLITGSKHLIEQKGREVYSVKNMMRVCIIGNEDWVVPASEDERRFAVFNVGDGRKKDTEFFTNMRVLLEEKEGMRLLLKELLKFDLSSVNINMAPETQGLIEQKIESLSHVHEWWRESIFNCEILGLEFSKDVWPKEVDATALRTAFYAYSKERGIGQWLPSATAFGKLMKKCTPRLIRKRKRTDTGRAYAYDMLSPQEYRDDFDEFIGHKLDWGDLDDEGIDEANYIFT